MLKLSVLFSGFLFFPLSIAQQRPFVDIDLFEERNKTFRTNVCERQRLLYEEELLLQDALRGLDLTVAITNYQIPNENAFFTLVNGKIREEDPGLFAVMLDELARRAGFEWRNSFAAIDPLDPVRFSNSTWSDMLEWEVNNFDIAADYWARSSDRMSRGISFPHGWYDGSIVFVASEVNEETFNLWSFLLPFEIKVWLAIVGGIFFTGIMYFILERLNTDSDELQLDEKPVTAIFLAAITFTGHFEFNPNTNAARLMSFSWTFWTLIMASAYTANMASFLVQRNGVESSVSTLDDAVRLSIPVCVQRGAIIDEMLSKKNPDLILVRKDSEEEMFQALKKDWYGGKGGCGVLMTNLGTFEVYQGQKSVNQDCTLKSEKRVILSLPAGFATAVDSGMMCTSLISYVFDYHLQEMERDGFIATAWNNHVEKISTISCDKSSSSVTQKGNVSLGMKDMGGIFITHSIATVVALVIAFYQYFYTKAKDPSKSLRPLSLTTKSTRLSECKSESILMESKRNDDTFNFDRGFLTTEHPDCEENPEKTASSDMIQVTDDDYKSAALRSE
jgi:Ligand-gated ion channel